MSAGAEQRLRSCRDRIVTIEEEFTDVMMGQYIFLEVQRIIEGNERLSSMGSHFFVYLERCFVDSLVLAVRRQWDTRSDVISLHRLLRDVGNRPLLITRDYFMSFWKVRPGFGKQAFDELVGVDKAHLERKQIQSDIELLVSKSQLVVDYAKTHVAHYGTKPLSAYPGMTDLLEANSCIYGLIRKYFTLLTGTKMGEFKTNFMYDWKAIFTFPWIESPQSDKRQ